MLLNVLDSTGVSQKIVVKGQEAVVDHSSTVTATGVSQLALSANALRSGFYFQNNGTHNIGLNDLGAATLGAGSLIVPPGGVVSTSGSGNYPLSINAVNVIGTATDAYTLREW